MTAGLGSEDITTPNVIQDWREESDMTSNGGVWIDHRGATIVLLEPTAERTVHVASNVEKHPERGGDRPLKGPYEPRQVPPDDRREMALTGRLNAYYDAVISVIRNLDALLIFGPGEAKGEFKKRLDRHQLGGRVAAIETTDKMTDRQIAAKVREYFSDSTTATRA